LIGAALALLAGSATPADRVGATAPLRINVQGAVLAPSNAGIMFRSNVPVSASDGADVTSAGGIFGFVATFTGFPFEIRALVDGVTVRKLATSFVRDAVVSVIIDPASEAGVEILESIGVDRFTLDGIEVVLAAVTNRNATTDYAGLDMAQAISVARRLAQDDPAVQRTIGEAMIEPRDVCVGDCDRGGTVTVNELVTTVNIALGNRPVGTCPSLDAGTIVDVSFLVKAIRNALAGCLAS